MKKKVYKQRFSVITKNLHWEISTKKGLRTNIKSRFPKGGGYWQERGGGVFEVVVVVGGG